MNAPRADIEDQSASLRLIALQEAAVILGASERTVRRWVAAGKMPRRFEEGRGKKFRLVDIEAMVKTESINLITLKQAAEMLGVTERTVRRWVAARKMPPRTKKGRDKKFWRADIQALLHRCKIGGVKCGLPRVQ